MSSHLDHCVIESIVVQPTAWRPILWKRIILANEWEISHYLLSDPSSVADNFALLGDHILFFLFRTERKLRLNILVGVLPCIIKQCSVLIFAGRISQFDRSDVIVLVWMRKNCQKMLPEERNVFSSSSFSGGFGCPLKAPWPHRGRAIPLDCHWGSSPGSH